MSVTTEQIVEAGAEQAEAHVLHAIRGADGVEFAGCDCGQWFGKALEGGWSRATRHVAQAAYDAMLPLIRKQLADEVRAEKGAGNDYRDTVLERAARLIEGVEA